MRFDIGSLGDYLPDPASGTFTMSQLDRFTNLVDMGVWAEELGFGGYWMGEHHAGHYIVSNPQLILASVAGQTSRIDLGSSVSLLANRDPVLLAEDFATLDLISKGRAILGVGTGISERAFKLFGHDQEHAYAMCEENLALIETIWNEEELNWSGRFRSPVVGRIEPRTVSGRALRIMRAVGSREDMARDAGRSGHRIGLLTPFLGFSGARHLADTYRKAYKEAGHDPAEMSVSGTAFLFIRPDGKKAREQFMPYFENYMNAGQKLSTDATATITKVVSASADAKASQRSEALMAGSPEEIIDMVHRADEAIGGITEIKFLCDIGGLPADEIRTTMKLFSDKVMPKIRTT